MTRIDSRQVLVNVAPVPDPGPVLAAIALVATHTDASALLLPTRPTQLRSAEAHDCTNTVRLVVPVAAALLTNVPLKAAAASTPKLTALDWLALPRPAAPIASLDKDAIIETEASCPVVIFSCIELADLHSEPCAPLSPTLPRPLRLDVEYSRTVTVVLTDPVEGAFVPDTLLDVLDAPV